MIFKKKIMRTRVLVSLSNSLPKEAKEYSSLGRVKIRLPNTINGLNVKDNTSSLAAGTAEELS